MRRLVSTNDDPELHLTVPLFDWRDALLEHLRAVGWEAVALRHLDPCPILRARSSRDLSYSKLQGRAASFLALRTGGLVIGRSTATTTVLGVEIAKRQLYPVELHFIVPRNPRPDPRAYEARLVVSTSGLFEPAIAGFRWRGQWLARRLDADREIRDALVTTIAGQRGLRVDADLDGHCVRVVLESTLVLSASRLGDRTAILDFAHPPPKLMAAIDAIARIAADG